MTPLTAEDRSRLIASGLIQMPEPAPAAPPPPRCPLPTLIIAPVPKSTLRTHLERQAAGLKPPRPRGPLPSVKQCRAACICIMCRVNHAKYYGEKIGYGVHCPQCMVARVAESQRRKQ